MNTYQSWWSFITIATHYQFVTRLMSKNPHQRQDFETDPLEADHDTKWFKSHRFRQRMNALRTILHWRSLTVTFFFVLQRLSRSTPYKNGQFSLLTFFLLDTASLSARCVSLRRRDEFFETNHDTRIWKASEHINAFYFSHFKLHWWRMRLGFKNTHHLLYGWIHDSENTQDLKILF